MRIKSLRIQNFRSIKDQSINFGDYNCLVGANGAGKSTVLNALNVFFHESKSSPVDLLELSKEDFHCQDTSEPIRITVTFGDLSEGAKEELKDYVRQEQLAVMAVAGWSELSQSAPVLQKGLRLGMGEFAPFFEASGDGKPVSELKQIYAELRKDFADLPAAATKPAMTDALRQYELKHPDKCILLESGDEFYGVSKGAHKLGAFVQWIFVPAVKDATDEQKETKETALGRLVERTVRSKVDFSGSIRALREKTNTEYDKLLGQNQSVLDGLSSSLQVRLAKWAHPQAELAVKWDKDQEKAVRVEEPFARIMAGECGFVGELGRFGHGFRRSFLLAILEELAGNDAAGAPRLLLGIEEPELFQHPPQAQYLGEVLQRLTEGNAQVFACTHSPHFVVGKGFEDVLLVRKPAGSTSAVVSRTTFQAVANHLTAALGEPLFTRAAGLRAKINQSLQPALREMFFAPTLVLVEGLEDVAYLTAGLHLLGLWEKWRATGAHIVPVNKKSELIRPLAIAQVLKIPTLVIFDADGDETRSSARVTHAKDNERLLRLLEKPTHELFPSTTTWERHFVVWPTNFGATVQADFPEEDWRSWKSEVEAELGQPGGLEKNSLFIAAVLSKAWETGKPSATLERTCKHVLQFAETSLK